ncbi:hypothetical protein FH620_27700 [Corallococcus exiguus]|nr:hypothetical protein FH620_27700 [Corallococcus exiguus]
MPRRRQEQGMSSTTKWVLAGLLGLPLLCCGSGGLMCLGIRSELPYAEAISRVENHAGVVRLLGAPISASSFFSGSFNLMNKDGQANMTINLSGSRQDGRLEVKAVRTDDVWGFSRLRVVADNGEAVDVGGYSRH